jgi:hypothetical protein
VVEEEEKKNVEPNNVEIFSKKIEKSWIQHFCLHKTLVQLFPKNAGSTFHEKC